MKYLKRYESLKKRLKKHFDDFDKRSKEAEPVTITTAKGKEITYNPVGREILNDTNINKYIVLNKYPFHMDDVKFEDRSILTKFIKNNVGQIIKATLAGGESHYDIKYNNVPRNLQLYFTVRSYDINNHMYLISIDENFDFISDNYKDCLTYIAANKYNL